VLRYSHSKVHARHMYCFNNLEMIYKAKLPGREQCHDQTAQEVAVMETQQQYPPVTIR